MRSLKEMTKVGANRSIGLDLIRMYLGIGLFVRGALFIAQPEVLLSYMERSKHWFIPLAASHYVVLAHLCGGLMLAVGLRTRIAAAVQVPPLLGAVFYVHFGEGLLSAGQSLEFAALVLFLLLMFGVYGSGQLSVDHLLETSKDPDEDIERERTLRGVPRLGNQARSPI